MMSKYKVTVHKIEEYSIEVEASDEDKAREKAENLLQEDFYTNQTDPGNLVFFSAVHSKKID